MFDTPLLQISSEVLHIVEDYVNQHLYAMTKAGSLSSLSFPLYSTGEDFKILGMMQVVFKFLLLLQTGMFRGALFLSYKLGEKCYHSDYVFKEYVKVADNFVT